MDIGTISFIFVVILGFCFALFFVLNLFFSVSSFGTKKNQDIGMSVRPTTIAAAMPSNPRPKSSSSVSLVGGTSSCRCQIMANSA